MQLTAEHIYSPSELNREVKLHLEMGFPRVLIEAEVSNLARPASGHLYFSLKDSKAQIRCAMFRSSASRTRVAVENGMKVLAKGRISLYEARGDYQFIVDSLEDAGEGILQRQFEELKNKLDKEGLFDPSHKKQVPAYPARIGLITSPGGAAVRDLLHVLARRWPVAEIRLYPTLVQGEEAPAKILQATQAASRQQWAETLIIGRGGGSLEDLMAFNSEAVARAVFAATVPVISAVGHETDFSICDFVADLRAPTPSAAAELATPDQLALNSAFTKNTRQLERRIQDRLQQETQKTDQFSHRLQQRNPARQLSEQRNSLVHQKKSIVKNIERKLGDQALALNTLARRLSNRHPDRMLAEFTDRINSAEKALKKSIHENIHSRREVLGGMARTLHAVSPLDVIGRGYAIVTRETSGEVVSSVRQVAGGDRLSAQVKDGQIECEVTGIRRNG